MSRLIYIIPRDEDCVFFQCLGSILIANISAGPPENPSWRCNMGEEQTEIYSKRGASGFLGRGLTWTGGDSTQYLTYVMLHFRLFQYQQQFQQHHRVRAKASTGWASPIPAEPQLCFPVCRYLCFRFFVFVLGFTVLYLNYTEISITRTCWTSLGCLPATGSVPPPHLPSKTKRWNILPSPKDPEKIELSSSSFFPVSLCSHSGKMSYYIFLPRLARSEIWAKLTSKTCQRYCARPLWCRKYYYSKFQLYQKPVVYFFHSSSENDINASISKSALNLPHRDLGSSWNVYRERWVLADRRLTRWVATWTVRKCITGRFPTGKRDPREDQDGLHRGLPPVLRRLARLLHGVLNRVLAGCKKEATFLLVLFPLVKPPTTEANTLADTEQPGGSRCHASHVAQAEFLACYCSGLPRLSSYVCCKTRTLDNQTQSTLSAVS